MTAPQLETETRPDAGLLICPLCKGTYLHHGNVEIFSRPEDGKLTHVTVVKRGGISETEKQLSSGCRNPSARRDGLRVFMWCELCYWDGWLCIAQHKGSTLVSWAPKLEHEVGEHEV